MLEPVHADRRFRGAMEAQTEIKAAPRIHAGQGNPVRENRVQAAVQATVQANVMATIPWYRPGKAGSAANFRIWTAPSRAVAMVASPWAKQAPISPRRGVSSQRKKMVEIVPNRLL